MPSQLHSAIPILLIVALLGWSMYRRVRRTVGWQVLVPRRLRNRAVVFAVVAVLLLTQAALDVRIAIFDAVGVVLGAALVYLAIMTTGFQQRGTEVYYRPNMWVGLGLVLILIGRVVFRLVYVYQDLGSLQSVQQGGSINSSQLSYANDPYIVSVFFLLCTYYIGYNLWLIRRHRQLVTNRRGDSNFPSR